MKKLINLIIVATILGTVLMSCYSTKNGAGCGSYSGWEAHTKFRSK